MEREHERWFAKRETEPGSAYAAHLYGDEGPRLPFHIDRQLMDGAEIVETDDVFDAAEKYRSFMEQST